MSRRPTEEVGGPRLPPTGHPDGHCVLVSRSDIPQRTAHKTAPPRLHDHTAESTPPHTQGPYRLPCRSHTADTSAAPPGRAPRSTERSSKSHTLHTISSARRFAVHQRGASPNTPWWASLRFADRILCIVRGTLARASLLDFGSPASMPTKASFRVTELFLERAGLRGIALARAVGGKKKGTPAQNRSSTSKRTDFVQSYSLT